MLETQAVVQAMAVSSGVVFVVIVRDMIFMPIFNFYFQSLSTSTLTQDSFLTITPIKENRKHVYIANAQRLCLRGPRPNK